MTYMTFLAMSWTMYDMDCTHSMKLVFLIPVSCYITTIVLYDINIFRKVTLTNVPYFDKDVTVFIDSTMNA